MTSPTHLTAQQIADLKLDGLPRSAHRIRVWAAKHGWAFVQHPDCLGGRHFAVASLPAAAQVDLKARKPLKRRPEPARSSGPIAQRACRALVAAIQAFSLEMWGDA